MLLLLQLFNTQRIHTYRVRTRYTYSYSLLPSFGGSVGGAHQLDVTTRRCGVLADDLVRDELLEVTLRASLDAVAGQAVPAERPAA